VGRKKLQQAMDATEEQFDFEVTWLPFLLRPEMPLEGKEKAPNTPDNPRVGAWMARAAGDTGVKFTGLCDRYPNPVKGHMLADLALPTGKQDEIATKLLEAYFTNGEDVMDVENLVKWGTTIAGLDGPELRTVLNDPKAVSDMTNTILRGQRAAGVSGVPFFFINGRKAFSGAQDPRTFIQAFEKA